MVAGLRAKYYYDILRRDLKARAVVRLEEPQRFVGTGSWTISRLCER